MTDGCSNGSRAATVCLDRGITRALDEGFAAFAGWRDAVLSRKPASSTSSAARSRWRRTGCVYGVTPGAPATRIAAMRVASFQVRLLHNPGNFAEFRGGPGCSMPTGDWCGFDRAILCSNLAEQRHKIIRIEWLWLGKRA